MTHCCALRMRTAPRRYALRLLLCHCAHAPGWMVLSSGSVLFPAPRRTAPYTHCCVLRVSRVPVRRLLPPLFVALRTFAPFYWHFCARSARWICYARGFCVCVCAFLPARTALPCCCAPARTARTRAHAPHARTHTAARTHLHR